MIADKKVRWGIVSTADIGMKKVTPGIMKSPHSKVVALASRDVGKARAALAELGIDDGRAYGSYEELFAIAEIGHDGGETIGAEALVALDKRDHALRLAFEQVAGGGDRVAADVHDAAAADIGLVADIVGVGVEIGEDGIRDLSL